MYSKGKMRPIETIPRMGGGEGQRRLREGVNLAKIYCKHFCECHNVALLQQYDNKTKIKKNSEKDGNLKYEQCLFGFLKYFKIYSWK
jgi:hypothetical protein